MRFALLLAVVGLFSSHAFAQVLLTENFEYAVGDTLTSDATPWVSHSGSGDSLLVTDNNLTFSGYPPSTGNSTFLSFGAGSREDAHLGFPPVVPVEPFGGATVVYSSMLINADSVEPAIPNGNYFFHLTQEAHDTTFRGRVFLRGEQLPGSSAADHLYQIGISKSSTSTIDWDTTIRTTGTTYLLVMKYTFNAGADDDTVDLYIFEDGDDISTEPVTPDISNIDVSSDLVDAGNVNLRQSGTLMGLTVDGIRVTRTWGDIVPVELVSFDATVSGSDVNLNWMTSSETNNAGFEVQLRGEGDFEAMGFVDGNGTTTVEQSYNYSINDLAPGTYTARLKQIDYDGAFEYSPQVEIAIGVPGTHILSQAYPNPFNPQASFSLAVATEQHVDVALYNALGQQVASLFSGQMEAGQARAFTIDGASLPSGSYYYRAIGESFAESGRVTLLK